MNVAYVFIEKIGVGKMRIALYGSVVSMHDHEEVVIGGKKLSLVAIRKLLKMGQNGYEDARYFITKSEIVRSKSKSKK